MKNKLLAILAVGMLAGPMAAHAVFIQSTDAAAAGFTTSTTYGFNELGLPTNTVVTTQYAGVTFSPNLVQGAQDCTGFPNMTAPCLANFSPVVDPWEILFGTTQTQAGFHMVTNPGTTTFQAYLGAVLIESLSLFTDFSSSNNFYGFSGISFDRIRVDTGGGNDSMLLDNLTFNVPEPGTLALLGLGLAGLGFSRRRKTA